ncbi:DUF1772 domain-containing protein [Coraliomargarita algicola]|uniref:DUF1772 domain-containing protein n=1 Tax=Coraliomargarita algicola TaxID=3092156 RepID=A0ABZ0RRG2_9BACT|nr:DUF1772 domain-containing protein [Coraliomargarita sp. J2-16]WPJ97492.1 DUF1772 domain-containing protein [Coraliomargarita sp. J2-16]
MIHPSVFSLLLGFATLSTALVAGLVFTFAVIIMPGIAKLDDRGFVRAFQVIDGIIQNGQPIFGLVWLGSILSLCAVSILGLWQLEGLPKWLLLSANLLYISGVQLPTFGINVPLNNQLQTIVVAESGEDTIRQAREHFEESWNLANRFRTYAAILVVVMLLLVLFLL